MSTAVDLLLVDIYDPKTDSWSHGGNLPTGHARVEASTFVHVRGFRIASWRTRNRCTR